MNKKAHNVLKNFAENVHFGKQAFRAKVILPPDFFKCKNAIGYDIYRIQEI